jgi:hypothetical protein
MIYDSDSAKNIRRSRAMNEAAEGKSQSSSSKNLLPCSRDFVVQRSSYKGRRTKVVIQISSYKFRRTNFVGQILSYKFCRTNFVVQILPDKCRWTNVVGQMA